MSDVALLARLSNCQDGLAELLAAKPLATRPDLAAGLEPHRPLKAVDATAAKTVGRHGGA